VTLGSVTNLEARVEVLYEMADAVLHLLPASRVERAFSETPPLAPSIVRGSTARPSEK
jgi:hypothetical protein